MYVFFKLEKLVTNYLIYCNIYIFYACIFFLNLPILLIEIAN